MKIGVKCLKKEKKKKKTSESTICTVKSPLQVESCVSNSKGAKMILGTCSEAVVTTLCQQEKILISV